MVSVLFSERQAASRGFGLRSKLAHSRFHGLVWSLIYGTAKPLIYQGRSFVSKILISGIGTAQDRIPRYIFSLGAGSWFTICQVSKLTRTMHLIRPTMYMGSSDQSLGSLVIWLFLSRVNW